MMGKEIIDSIGKTATDLIRGRAQEQKPEIEIGETLAHISKKSISISKWLVYGIIVFFMVLGAYIILKQPLKMPSFVSFMISFGTLFIPYVLIVGTGRAFKHSKWNKDR